MCLQQTCDERQPAAEAEVWSCVVDESLVMVKCEMLRDGEENCQRDFAKYQVPNKAFTIKNLPILNQHKGDIYSSI